ncbi:MAG: hypothetical protein D3M94_14375 [Rhodocyclales bacterium GT-UBC]|nr:MAG: hypothetical protein D3M94_14375 [Rhodocyclales bacterium GT-UBC]
MLDEIDVFFGFRLKTRGTDTVCLGPASSNSFPVLLECDPNQFDLIFWRQVSNRLWIFRSWPVQDRCSKGCKCRIHDLCEAAKHIKSHAAAMCIITMHAC